jgi:hypothetical protein
MSVLIREEILRISQIVICSGMEHARKLREAFYICLPFSNATGNAIRPILRRQMHPDKITAAREISVSPVAHSRLSRSHV